MTVPVHFSSSTVPNEQRKSVTEIILISLKINKKKRANFPECRESRVYKKKRIERHIYIANIFAYGSYLFLPRRASISGLRFSCCTSGADYRGTWASTVDRLCRSTSNDNKHSSPGDSRRRTEACTPRAIVFPAEASYSKAARWMAISQGDFSCEISVPLVQPSWCNKIMLAIRLSCN